MKYAIFSLALLSMLLGACSDRKNTCLIQVGDVCINRQTFEERMARFAEESMITSQDQLEAMKPVFVNNIIEEELVLQHARKGFVTVSDEEVDIAMKGLLEGIDKEGLDRLLTEESRNIDDMREFVRKRALIKRTIEREVHKDIVVTAEQIRQYYEAHKDEFVLEPTVELYHVFMKNNYQAKEALKRLRSGMSLEAVAREFGEAEGVEESSGFMGVFAQGDLPKDVEEVVFSIPPRRYSNIIKTQRGYHIFYVANKTEGGTLSLIEASDQIREKLVEESFEKKYATWIEDLKKEYRVEVNWSGIHEVSISG
ncbi:MAG TPA: peptidyl-prolyl cis-trans isomerase [Desulfomonilia bacterium]|jgi:parvulin-like peptidyl-prolyl isomerase|nr:peptidyl-prolyl cis-trans isomerase [Deltaproteobacteria bacterium]HPD20376.1 peptidyl-prolyl cis-trans isomerase [Deltaproteobacteria bacterium]HRS55210.1 peptidyl-prolyl cis-trans isomerase [Desulfomonilia bacterium]